MSDGMFVLRETGKHLEMQERAWQSFVVDGSGILDGFGVCKIVLC